MGIFDYSGAEEHFKRLVDLANNAKLAYQEMVEEYEKEECENLIVMHSKPSPSSFMNNHQVATTSGILYSHPFPKVPSHMAHSRTSSNGSNISIDPYLMNYHTHSRSASGTFNYGSTTGCVPPAVTNAGGGGGVVSGHVRSASGGGPATVFANIEFPAHKHWNHSRTPSNCSNISFISRLSEPISEVGGSMGALYMGMGINGSTSNLAPYFAATSAQPPSSQNNTAHTINSAFVAVQHYNEQVRQEMNMGVAGGESELSPALVTGAKVAQELGDKVSPVGETEASVKPDHVVNVAHLGSINEIDAGNEADTEGECVADGKQSSKQTKKSSSPAIEAVTTLTNNLSLKDDKES